MGGSRPSVAHAFDVGIPPGVEVVRIEDRELDLAVLGQGDPLDGPEYSAREDGSDPFGVYGHALPLPRSPCGRNSAPSIEGQGCVDQQAA